MRIVGINTSVGNFKPEVTVTDTSVTVAEAQFSYHKESGTMPAATYNFGPEDAGKHFYIILIKVGEGYRYDCLVSDPSAAKLPFSTAGEERYPFLAGTVQERGLDVEVRHFLSSGAS